MQNNLVVSLQQPVQKTKSEIKTQDFKDKSQEFNKLLNEQTSKIKEKPEFTQDSKQTENDKEMQNINEVMFILPQIILPEEVAQPITNLQFAVSEEVQNQTDSLAQGINFVTDEKGQGDLLKEMQNANTQSITTDEKLLKPENVKEQKGQEKLSDEKTTINPSAFQSLENLNFLTQSEVLQVKSAQTPVFTNEYLQQLNSDIAGKIALGNNSFEVQLHPENLGVLTVKASFENGQSVVTIICNEAKALQEIAKNADDLALILQSKTGNQTDVVIQTTKNDYLENNQQNNQHQPQNHDEQAEKRQKQTKEYIASDDFLQQLRLGLAGL